MRVTIVLVALLAAPSAMAAMLRPLSTLHSDVVRLSDLFDDAGPRASLALGPAPQPGQSITVEAPQLAYIARTFGVAWRPASEGDRAVLERPGVPLPRAAVLAALRAALDGAGAPEGDVDLPGFEAPLVAPEARAQAAVEQMAFDAGSGRFSAGLVVTGSDMAPLHLRLDGQLQAMEQVLVAAHRLDPGELLSAADLKPARMRSAALPGEVVRSAAQAQGLAPRRIIAAGEPLPLASLAPPLLVRRGSLVAISLRDGGLALSSLGQALEPGGAGDRIRVLNPVSRAVLVAEVTGPGTVQVEPGSVPLQPGGDSQRSIAAPLLVQP